MTITRLYDAAGKMMLEKEDTFDEIVTRAGYPGGYSQYLNEKTECFEKYPQEAEMVDKAMLKLFETIATQFDNVMKVLASCPPTLAFIFIGQARICFYSFLSSLEIANEALMQQEPKEVVKDEH